MHKSCILEGKGKGLIKSMTIRLVVKLPPLTRIATLRDIISFVKLFSGTSADERFSSRTFRLTNIKFAKI